jgi:hypothetical protein
MGEFWKIIGDLGIYFVVFYVSLFILIYIRGVLLLITDIINRLTKIK